MSEATTAKDDSNELRCVAAEIVRQLYLRGNGSQLELLKAQVDRSLEELRRKAPTIAEHMASLAPAADADAKGGNP